MKTKIYVALSQFCEDDNRPLRALEEAGLEATVNRSGRRLVKEEMAGLLRDADGVLAGVEPYDAALLSKLPRLRCISRCGTGTDAIDLSAAREHGVAVLTTRDEVVRPVAELAVSMILALARNLPLHKSDFQRGQWKKHTGVLLSEWTIGLVGFGRIGRAVETLLRPFGCRILTSDPALKPRDLPEGVTLTDFDSLLSRSDLVSLHASQSPEKGALVGPRELGLMKPGGRLVNTSRGHLIDEAALLKALESGRLSGAALDVFEKEPYTGPLGALPQVLCTPHVATLTRASRTAMELRAALNIAEFFGREAASRSPAAAGKAS